MKVCFIKGHVLWITILFIMVLSLSVQMLQETLMGESALLRDFLTHQQLKRLASSELQQLRENPSSLNPACFYRDSPLESLLSSTFVFPNDPRCHALLGDIGERVYGVEAFPISHHPFLLLHLKISSRDKQFLQVLHSVVVLKD